jgi:hypothetical protein
MLKYVYINCKGHLSNVERQGLMHCSVLEYIKSNKVRFSLIQIYVTPTSNSENFWFYQIVLQTSLMCPGVLRHYWQGPGRSVQVLSPVHITPQLVSPSYPPLRIIKSFTFNGVPLLICNLLSFFMIYIKFTLRQLTF